MAVSERLYCRFCSHALGLCWTEVVRDSEGNVCPCYVASALPPECPQCFDRIDATAIDKALEECDFEAAGLVINPNDKDNPNNLGQGVVHLNGGECLLGSQLYYPGSDDVTPVKYPFTPRARVEAETGPYDESVSVPANRGDKRSHVLYTEDFQLGGVPPLAGENALPLPPFADKRNAIYRVEQQVFLPPKYGCLCKGPDLPSIGEEPMPHKLCAAERGFDGVPDIEAGESMFPPVPPSVAMNPLSGVTPVTSLCPDAVSSTEKQSDVDYKQQQEQEQEQKGEKIEQSTTIPLPYADLLPERRLPLPRQNKAQKDQHSTISFGSTRYGNNLQAPPLSHIPLPQNHQPTETVSSATLSPFSHRPSQDPHTPAAADNTSTAFSEFDSPAALSAPQHTTSQSNSSGHVEHHTDTDDRQSSREIDSATPTIAPLVVDVFPTQQTVEITEIPSPSSHDDVTQDDETSPTSWTTHQTSTTPMPPEHTEPPQQEQQQQKQQQQPEQLSSTPDNDVHAEASGSEYDPTAEIHSSSPAVGAGSPSPHAPEPGPGPVLKTGGEGGVSPSASFQTDETASSVAPSGSTASSGSTRRPRKRARLTVQKYAGKRKGSRT